MTRVLILFFGWWYVRAAVTAAVTAEIQAQVGALDRKLSERLWGLEGLLRGLGNF